ncbi:MAG: hypothetical protein ACPGU7_10590, partial [Gammaproteobacteria bacterium]
RLLAVWLSLVVVGLELGLRLIGFSNYWAFSRTPDPYRGFKPMAGVSARQMAEGDAWVRINSVGFRDREWTAKAEGVHRIAVLGDSFTEAVQVPVERTWWRVLEGRLRACGYRGGEVEVLNFAVSGYSTAQALETLRREVPAHGADEVLLAFFVGNDVAENHPDLNPDPVRPYLLPTEDGWVMDYGFREHPSYTRRIGVAGRLYRDLVPHSRLIQAVSYLLDLHTVMGMRGGEQARWYWEPGIDARVYAPPRDPQWRQAWAATAELLRRLDRESRRQGASLRLVSVSSGVQVHPDRRGPDALARRLAVPDLFYPEWWLSRTADELGIRYLALAPALSERARREGAFFHGLDGASGTGHWNAQGHDAAARLVADALCRDP